MYDPIHTLKLQIEFMNRGVVPLGATGASIWHDINKVLASLPPAEAREMKRKFRKEWRRLVKREVRHGGKRGRREAREMGLGVPTPTRNQKNNRKAKVMYETNKKINNEIMQKLPRRRQ